ncbi:phage tail protein [Lysinibacillus fusiformis]|uniref:phage tail protein n=1 Tax=Lysinibacillus fusiformis TaxID=28031 RepID=UPI0035BEF9EF|nr:phage tail protein [Lysinibacillus fusiformis]
MAKIGSFGDVIFEVSQKKTLTFNDLEMKSSAKWDEHSIHRNKAKLEFDGPGLIDLSYSLLLRAELGINPMKEIAKLDRMKNKGEAHLFILGQKPIAPNKFVITDSSAGLKNIDQKGNVLSAEVTLSLKEYVDSKSQVKKTTTNTQKKAATGNKKSLGTITITVKSVHIRNGPSVNNKVLGYAMNGQKLTVYEEKNGWYSLGGGKYITASNLYSALKKG